MHSSPGWESTSESLQAALLLVFLGSRVHVGGAWSSLPQKLSWVLEWLVVSVGLDWAWLYLLAGDQKLGNLDRPVQTLETLSK